MIQYLTKLFALETFINKEKKTVQTRSQLSSTDKFFKFNKLTYMTNSSSVRFTVATVHSPDGYTTLCSRFS